MDHLRYRPQLLGSVLTLYLSTFELKSNNDYEVEVCVSIMFVQIVL